MTAIDRHAEERRRIKLSSEELAATRLALETAQKRLEREIDLLWHRGIYFWTFVAAIFAARAFDNNNSTIDVLLACAGYLISLCWLLANMGSKYWQAVWEQKVKALESNITGPLLDWEVDMDAEYWLKGRRFSVSRLAIAVSGITALFWFVILIHDSWKLDWSPGWSKWAPIVAIVILTWMLCHMSYSRKAK